ncbi:hypothetical protein IWW38_002410 [Coemansia aciculifera]|uniref:Uncharacterized protein n=1 Tax=Coemansia aciculifera TaxID=417176 RepID=A0ACC1M3B0_9FUNG|nr:hypothetical protein IWW38_002410 [Coemansia aciculifera]
MEHTDAEVARVFSALQGRFAGHSLHQQQQSLPSSPSKTGGEASSGGEKQANVWVIPAGVGSDLARPATLSALVEQWALLEESQKINALLGIAHVGQSKMQPVGSSVARLAELAKEDSTSDWVRVLGCTLGSVGVTGKMTGLGDLESGSAVRAELEAAAEQLYAAALAKQSELQLSAGMLACVSSQVAEAMAPPAIRNVYGERPSAELLDQVMARAESEQVCGNVGVRRAPAAPASSTSAPESRRPSAAEPSPDPSDAAAAATTFSDLFGGSGSDDNNDDLDAGKPKSRLCLHVRSSHRADHVGRMARLLAAAAEPPPASADPRRPSFSKARSSAAGSAATTPGPGSAGPSSGARKIGMFAPRRRAAPTNTALPGSGLGTSPAVRRGSEAAGGSGTQPGQAKKIQFAEHTDHDVMNARENLMQERREKLAEEREAKRLKRAADIEDRKRRRAEAAEERRVAIAEGRAEAPRRGRPRGAANRAVADTSSGNESDEANDDDNDNDNDNDEQSASATPAPVPVPEPEPVRPNVHVSPEEYRNFNGNDQTIRAIYAETNALTDEGRMQLYYFFNGYPPPPDTPSVVRVVLNERVIDDPTRLGELRREITVLEVNFDTASWEKRRQHRRVH